VKRELGSRLAAAAHLQPQVADASMAAATEDDFDAAITSTALLRRLRGDKRLVSAVAVDRRAEGGILCA